MTDTRQSARDAVRDLLRVRQVREFTDEPVTRDELGALADVARWSGSSSNSQPWRFITLDDVSAIRQIGEAALPQTRPLQTATAAIAIVVPAEPANRQVSFAYDEGRAAERILAGAYDLGLAAGICWIMSANLPPVRRILGVPDDWIVRTIVAIGHPTDQAKQPKSAPGQARLPREEVVFENRWAGK